MNAIKSLLSSEKAIFVGLLIIAATVLAAIGKMSVDVWTSYTQILAGIYVSGKTIQGTAAVIMAKGGEVGHLPEALSNNDKAADAAAKAKAKTKPKE